MISCWISPSIRGRPVPIFELASYFAATSSRSQRSSVSGVTMGRDLSEPASAQPLCRTGKPTPLGIREPQAFAAELVTENSVLFLEILDHLLLVAAKPSGEKNDQQLQRQRCHRETLDPSPRAKID